MRSMFDPIRRFLRGHLALAVILFMLIVAPVAAILISEPQVFNAPVEFAQKVFFSGNGVIGDTLPITNGGITIDGATVITSAGTKIGPVAQEIYNTTGTARTILASESGTTFIVTDCSDDPVTFNLPAAAANLKYKFIDNDVTAAADLTIDSATGDKIDNGTAAANISCRTDGAASIEVECIDGTNWITGGALGTWTAEGS